MKKLVYLIVMIVALGLIVAGCALLTVPPSEVSELDSKAKPSNCATIQDGTIFASTGELLTTGYDDWGYNYQAHQFNGRYCDYDRISGGDDCDVTLVMKWNDAWLSNKDCGTQVKGGPFTSLDPDGLLDRHYPYDSYSGSGAWCTNHQSGEYLREDDKICKWTYFVKIVAAPADAETVDGIWYTADGTEIGEVIWGAYAVVQEVSNDPCAGEHGILYHSPANPGLGNR